MRLSFNWLSELVDLSGITPAQLADRMTNAGLEVEGLESLASGTNLVIGEVLECRPHPRSDHLQITRTRVGDQEDEVRQIICGAPNCRPGLKVIVALPGAELPDKTIQTRDIRGEISDGMLCSLLELGVEKKYLRPEQIAGIEELPEDAPVGSHEVLHYLGLDDTILDVSLTPNRADCSAMWNMAHEVSAILHRPLSLPQCKGAADIGEPGNFRVATATDKCSVFYGKVVNHVRIGPSPEWMRRKLHAYGMNSINNVVDISNIVMLETGQPLHYYNLDKLPAHEITVRDDRALTFKALDGKDFEIQKGDLLITQGGEVTGIAGIMGGEESMIDENTHSIFIEAAQFNYAQIRRTSIRLNLMTEAAQRYAKGLEPQSVLKAMDRSVQLLSEYADASGFEQTVHAGTVDTREKVIVETLSHCNDLLGTKFTMDQVTEVLKWLDFRPEVNGDAITCHIPSYRIDMEGKADVDEEVIRLIGFDSLEDTLPRTKPTVGSLNHVQKLRRLTQDTMIGFGFNEIISYTLVPKAYVEETGFGVGEPIPLAMPMSEAHAYVRTDLMNSMLETIAYNQNHGSENNCLFEISRVYGKDIEGERLGLILDGRLNSDPLHHNVWHTDFYTLKGILESWLGRCGFQKDRISFRQNQRDTKHYHPYASAEVWLDDTFLGLFGRIHPAYAEKFDLKDILYAEMDMQVAEKLPPSRLTFADLDRFPSVIRDVSMIVDRDLPAETLLQQVTGAGSAIVRSAEIIDIYEGEHVEKGRKSVALRITYQSDERTLTDEEVDAEHQKIVLALQENLQAVLRV